MRNQNPQKKYLQNRKWTRKSKRRKVKNQTTSSSKRKRIKNNRSQLLKKFKMMKKKNVHQKSYQVKNMSYLRKAMGYSSIIQRCWNRGRKVDWPRNGCWSMDISTLRNLRKFMQNYRSSRSERFNQIVLLMN